MSKVQAEGFELYLTVAAGTRNSGNDYSPNMLSAEVSWPVVRVRLWENLQEARVKQYLMLFKDTITKVGMLITLVKACFGPYSGARF